MLAKKGMYTHPYRDHSVLPQMSEDECSSNKLPQLNSCNAAHVQEEGCSEK